MTIDEANWQLTEWLRNVRRANKAARRHTERNRLLEDENAKLRELVGILCYCMQFGADCDRCKMNGEDGKLTFDATCACDGLREMLRELGVEVGDVN